MDLLHRALDVHGSGRHERRPRCAPGRAQGCAPGKAGSGGAGCQPRDQTRELRWQEEAESREMLSPPAIRQFQGGGCGLVIWWRWLFGRDGDLLEVVIWWRW